MSTAMKPCHIAHLPNRYGQSGNNGQALLDTEPYLTPALSNGQGSTMELDSIEKSLPDTRGKFQATPVRVDRCVHDLIEEQACRQPEAPAVCSWDGDLTYRSLQRLSSKLAHYLRTLGAGPEKVIPFCFEKSLWAVVATVAILKSGSAFVALDPSTPETRRTGVVQETDTRIVVTSPSQVCLFEGIGAYVVVISSAFIDSLEEFDSKPCLEVSPENAAFVLFTSGSTGQPKGIVQDHGAVCTVYPKHICLRLGSSPVNTNRHIGTMCSSYGKALYLDAGCRVLQFASYNFDVSIVDIVDTLIHGACLCIPSEYDRTNNIVNVMNIMKVTWADLTPSFAGTFTPEDVPTLQTLVLAGEEVQQGHIARWAGKIRLINCYGPAESSACTAYEYTSPLDQPGTIGYPMAHANCWVVDVDFSDQLASLDSTGELVVESPALARGYLNNPEKTKASFIQDPKCLRACGSLSGRRVYKTGDLVRYQSNGSLKFVGRKDTQVKIRGQRVELSEVEHLLSMLPAVTKCIIAYPKSGYYTKRLIAIVQLRVLSRSNVDEDVRLLSHEEIQNVKFDTNEATEYLKQILPAYMIPTAWIAVESIPLTSSKKTDRRRVELWLEKEATQAQQFDAMGPSGLRNLPVLCPDESVAARVSTIVVEVGAEGNDQLREALEGRNFALSAVGIDSIQVISISRRIEREFIAKIGVERLTNNETTIRSLAAEIESSKDKPSSVVPSAPIDIFKEVRNLFEGLLLSASPQQHKNHSVDPHPTENVFLTGATGFLGTQILHQLFLQPSIKSMILHVRVETPEEGLARTIEVAKAAKWWSESFTPKIEIWLGDLTKPRLGLTPQQWQRLTGSASPEENVHSIIHNGGVVRWNADYHTLKPANTLSTAELLGALSASPRSTRFTYISGGQRLSFNEETETALTAQATRSNGYAQSKLVSELLVKRFASTPSNSHHPIFVIKPSYIIGTVAEGLANPSDYLWRLVAGSVEIGAYNADEADQWLFVSDVGHVAQTVVQHSVIAAHSSRSSNGDAVRQPSRILDGVPLGHLWHILVTNFGYELRPMQGREWWARMRTNVEEKGSQHCLWPLSYMLEEGKGSVGSAPPAPGTEDPPQEMTERIKAAVKMNIRHLQKSGFLQTATGLERGQIGIDKVPMKVAEGAAFLERGATECETVLP